MKSPSDFFYLTFYTKKSTNSLELLKIKCYINNIIAGDYNEGQ